MTSALKRGANPLQFSGTIKCYEDVIFWKCFLFAVFYGLEAAFA